MLDAVTLDAITVTPSGISGRMGPMWLALTMGGRDVEHIMDAPRPVRVETALEFDVTSGALTCLGFAAPEGKALYTALRTIKGVGMATALAVLDAGEPLDTLRAAAASDQAFFTRVPGLGPTRAKALIAHLRGHFGAILPAPLPVPVTAWVEARDALVSNGMDIRDAEEALHQAAAQGATRARDLLAGASAAA